MGTFGATNIMSIYGCCPRCTPHSLNTVYLEFTIVVKDNVDKCPETQWTAYWQQTSYRISKCYMKSPMMTESLHSVICTSTQWGGVHWKVGECSIRLCHQWKKLRPRNHLGRSLCEAQREAWKCQWPTQAVKSFNGCNGAWGVYGVTEVWMCDWRYLLDDNICVATLFAFQ